MCGVVGATSLEVVVLGTWLSGQSAGPVCKRPWVSSLLLTPSMVVRFCLPGPWESGGTEVQGQSGLPGSLSGPLVLRGSDGCGSLSPT